MHAGKSVNFILTEADGISELYLLYNVTTGNNVEQSIWVVLQVIKELPTNEVRRISGKFTFCGSTDCAGDINVVIHVIQMTKETNIFHCVYIPLLYEHLIVWCLMSLFR